MKNTLIVASLAAMFSASSAWPVDTRCDVKVVKRKSLVIPGLQRAASNAPGYRGKEVEVKSTTHQISIVVINSRHNDESAANREAEAPGIVSAAENEMAQLPEFAQVAVIHIDYLKRSGANAKPVRRPSKQSIFTSHQQVHL
jgi:hypothetical protein